MHDDDLAISDALARSLLDAQFPRYRGLTLRREARAGTVNVIFRLGADLGVRFPRRARDPDGTREALEQEALRSAEFAACSTVPAPEPVGIGAPTPEYPMAWSIQTWVAGTTASPTDSAGSVALAHDLAALVSALRATPTRGRRFSRGPRGGDLRSHDGWVETCLARSRDLVDVAALRRVWRRWSLTARDQPDRMTHGDLIPGNVLVEEGRLVGVLDTGGFGPADPALDLIAGWHLLGDRAREVFRSALGCSDEEWDRGRAWALEQAIGAAWYYRTTDAAMHEMGMTTLRRLLDSER